MATISAVKVIIREADVITALNTKGGAVREWVDEVGIDTLRNAEASAPVNNPLNARHRGGVTGTYAASFRYDRRGSRGHRVIGRVTNNADHAIYVEEGRGAAVTPFQGISNTGRPIGGQRFSWTVWGGAIRKVEYTGPRPGHHTLRKAFEAACEVNGV
jgi:hypothetical protein